MKLAFRLILHNGMTGCYEREADGRVNSFLDKNELELKDGSVPKAALE
ncbi:hypothetical protein V5096_11725 [Pseudoalteromonas carrageenovora]